MKTAEIPDASLWQGEHDSQKGCLLLDTLGEEESLLPVQQEKNVAPE